MLAFPYLPERIRQPAPPTVPVAAQYYWRPLLPVKLTCTGGPVLRLGRALLDTGSQETVFPMTLATTVGLALLPPTTHSLLWRGTRHPLRFGTPELQLETSDAVCRWSATIGFSSAAIKYPILGIAGILEYFDVMFLGESRVVTLAPNAKFPGHAALLP